jgi:hypothetical protein
MKQEQIQRGRKILSHYKVAVDSGVDAVIYQATGQVISAGLEILPAALDEIERLHGVIEKLWEQYTSTCRNAICAVIDCSEFDCGSPECKKAFMERYLGV